MLPVCSITLSRTPLSEPSITTPTPPTLRTTEFRISKRRTSRATMPMPRAPSKRKPSNSTSDKFVTCTMEGADVISTVDGLPSPFGQKKARELDRSKYHSPG